ncbi:MAG TPA: UPF0149 family protein [Nevskiaceae bacterium]|nr:UPF0149 family protein [Nevskiaceae bacterium]
MSTLHYSDLGAELGRIGLPGEPAGYHGALCGALCVRQPEEIDLVALTQTEADTPHDDPAAHSLLQRLARQALDGLQDEQLSFSPLLPDDAAALGPRVRALSSWCEGFLFGLSSRAGLDLDAVSEDAREIIRDFTQFTHASISVGENAEVEESAYAELVEYIRVGAQLIYMELRPAPTPDPSRTKSLH